MRFALTALFLIACGGSGLHRFPHASIVVPSPMRGGALPTATVSTTAPMEPDYRVTSQTPTDEATLTALDAGQICVQVTLRTVAVSTPLTQYQVFLRANDHVRSDARIEQTSQATTSIEGERYEITGHSSPCVAHHGHTCTRRSQHTSGHFVSSSLELLTQAGTACFANEGFVTASTDAIEIYFVEPGDEYGVGFAWELGGR
jgi:hypothetical protein